MHLCTLYIFPDTAVDGLSFRFQYIDGRIAGSRRAYSDNFQRSIKSPRVHEFCQTHFDVETYMVDITYKTFNCFRTFLKALDK